MKQQTLKISERPDNSPAFRPISNPEPLRVQAEPVNQFVAPGGESEIIGLARGLQDFHQGFGAYADQMQKRQNEEDYAKGQLQRMQAGGSEVKPTLTQQQSYAFQQGYMFQHGQIMGQDAGNKMLAYHEQNKNTPGYDPQQAIDQIKGQDLAGMDHFPDSMKGYVQGAERAEQAVRHDFLRVQTEQVREQRITMLSQSLSNNLATANSPEEAHAAYQAIREQGRAMNLTTPEIAKLQLESLTARALDKGPDELKSAYIEDASGMSLAKSSPEIAQHLEQVKHVADERQKEREKASAEPIRMRMMVDAHQNLDLGKFEYFSQFSKPDEKDPLVWARDFISAHSGPNDLFQTPEAAAGFMDKYLTKLTSGTTAAATDNYMGIYRSNAANIFMGQPAMKKIHEEEGLRLGAALISAKTDEEFNGVLRTMLDDQQRTGKPYDTLERIVKSGLIAAPDAKGEPSQQFLMGAKTYLAAKAANPNMAAQLIGDGPEKAMMDNFLHFRGTGMPDARAFEMAQQAASPEGKKAAQSYINDAAIKNARKLPGSLGSYFGEDLNVTHMQDVAEQHYRDNIKKGYANEQAALTETKEWLENRFVKVNESGTRTFGSAFARKSTVVEVPAGADPSRFGKAVENHLAALADKEGINAPKESYSIMKGEGDTYVIKDETGNPHGIVTGKALMDAQYVRERTTGPQVQQSNNLNQLFQRDRTPADPRQDADRQVYALNHLPEIRYAYARKQMDAETYSIAINLAEKEQHRRLALQAQGIKQDFADPSSILNLMGRDPNAGPKMDTHLGVDLDQNRDVRDQQSLAYAQKQTDPGKKITMTAEGFKGRVYQDNQGRAIGYGWNIDKNGVEATKDAMRRAQVADPDAVIAGKVSLTPEQGERMLDISLKSAEGRVRAAVGNDEYEKCPPILKGLLNDMAFNAGDITQFKTVLGKVQAHDYLGAAQSMSISYQDPKTKKMVKNERRIGIWRSAMSGALGLDARIEEARNATPTK